MKNYWDIYIYIELILYLKHVFYHLSQLVYVYVTTNLLTKMFLFLKLIFNVGPLPCFAF